MRAVFLGAAALLFSFSALAQDAPPNINVAYPPTDTVLLSGNVPFDIRAWDDAGITQVRLYDGATIIKTFSQSQSGVYPFIWNTDLVAEGSHQIHAVARDSAGQETSSPAISATVKHSGLAVVQSSGFDGSTIGLRVSDAFGGSIYSLIWKSTQLLPQSFGSQLQSTLYMNGLASKCAVYESGSYNESDPSIVNYVVAGTAWVETDQKLKYAYPSQTLSDAGGCGMEHDVLFHKRVTMNYSGLANVIEHDVAYTTTTTYQRSVPLGYTHGTFMATSSNVPMGLMGHHGYYRLSTHQFLPQPDSQEAASSIDVCGGDGSDCMPVLYNDDGSLAFGVYQPGDVYNLGGGNPAIVSYYTNEWHDCVDRCEAKEPINEIQCRYNWWPAMPPGTYKFKCYSIVGSLFEVTVTLDALKAMQ